MKREAGDPISYDTDSAFTPPEMEPFLGALQNPDLSSVLSSCEPELQELMKQIDIMISNQRAEWQAEVKRLQLRLKAEGEELQASRSLTARQGQEIRSLRRQLDGQPGHQGLVRKYEQQLQKVREELEKLKKSYHKLQRKQMKEKSSATPTTEAVGSETTILHKKIEEYQQLCVEWEQQRIQLQKQVAALEVQNKRLNDELTLSTAQWDSLNQEQREHRGSYAEVHRLRTQLEAAQGHINSQELELERLRALDLESRLGWNQREQQASAADSQDSFVQRASLERQRLLSEASRLNLVLQAKDQVICCLEGCLAAQGCTGVELLRQDLEDTSTRLQRAQSCEAELRAELACVTESRQRSEQPNLEEVRILRAQYDSSVAEARKLREELLRARQTHGGELDGVRKEVSRLTAELHRRDLAIASMEAERVQQNTAELKTPPLETLQAESQNLKSCVRWLESPFTLMAAAASSSPPRESHIMPAGGPEQQNQRLRTTPAQLRPQGSALTCPEKYEGALLSHAVTERLQQGSDGWYHQQGEQSDTRSEAEIQRLFQQLHTSTPPLPSEDTRPRSAASSSSLSLSSSSSSSFTTTAATSRAKSSRRHLLESSAEGRSSSSDETLTGRKPPSPAAEVSLSFSPAERMVSRFLEEENVFSSQLLQRLDSHIQGMIHDNVMTVTRFLPGTAGPQPDQDQDLSPDQEPS